MTNNQKERDAAIERLSKRWQKKVGLGTRNLAHIYEEGAKGGWNASRKHRDLQIADELDSLVSYNVETGRYEVEDTVGQYIDGLREGTK